MNSTGSLCTDCDLDPILLCNELGADTPVFPPVQSQTVLSSGRTGISVKEAVQIARDNNFMGLICSSPLLVSLLYSSSFRSQEMPGQEINRGILQELAPGLIESIKNAGLVLITDISEAARGTPVPSSLGLARPARESVPKGVDGYLKGNGVLRFNESIDM